MLDLGTTCSAGPAGNTALLQFFYQLLPPLSTATATTELSLSSGLTFGDTSLMVASSKLSTQYSKVTTVEVGSMSLIILHCVRAGLTGASLRRHLTLATGQALVMVTRPW